MSNGNFSVSWLMPQNQAKRKQLLLDLDEAVRRLRIIETKPFKLGKAKAQNSVIATAEALLSEFSVELAEARAEEAVKAHQVDFKSQLMFWLTDRNDSI